MHFHTAEGFLDGCTHGLVSLAGVPNRASIMGRALRKQRMVQGSGLPTTSSSYPLQGKKMIIHCLESYKSQRAAKCPLLLCAHCTQRNVKVFWFQLRLWARWSDGPPFSPQKSLWLSIFREHSLGITKLTGIKSAFPPGLSVLNSQVLFPFPLKVSSLKWRTWVIVAFHGKHKFCCGFYTQMYVRF